VDSCLLALKSRTADSRNCRHSA